MKTVFGHALIEEGYNAPIYNVLFDQSGNFLISGADDGIIKIWDKDTLNLQASLHSHEDVITDMDMSKCNTYLATASKDGKIIVWNWKKCAKVDEIAAHNGTVNNIKFFSIKVKSSKDNKKEEQIQVLVTCSEDGTIKIYDEINYLNSQQLNSQEAKRNRTRHESHQPKKERYHICLTPEDYRPGSRNKKIDSVHINQNGIVVGGSDRGEIFLWELDIHAFKRQYVKAAQYLGTSKKHQKAVHFCEFSPNGKYLFTGSIDGTAKIWNVEKEKGKKTDPSQKNLVLTDDRLLTTLQEKRNNWQCDSLVWSAFGRYAIAAISGKVEGDKSKEHSVIKIWDSCTNTTIQDITKINGVQLLNFSFVLAAHPKIEEIFMSGSDGGIICLWNIKTRQLIQKFLEYGVYSFEKYTMNDPYDGKFSPDGSSFVVGSVMGTISLFSCEGAPYKYQGTRVEQFYQNDDTKHNINIYYEESNEEPQVCGYSLLPYEVQPPSSHIGKFQKFKQMTNEEYERNLLIRKELCHEEEKFIQEQLEEGLRNDMFNPDNQQNQDDFRMEIEEADEDHEDLNGIRRAGNRQRLDSQLSQISHNNRNINASQEDVEILNGIQNAEQNRMRRNDYNARRQMIRNRVNQMMNNPNFDPDNSLYDRESDENFQAEEDEEVEESAEEEDFIVEDSEEEYGIHSRSHNANQANQNQRSQRLNVRTMANNILRREENKRIENQRSIRAQRRQQRLEEEEEKIQIRGSRRRRAIIEEDSEESEDSVDIEEVERRLERKRKLVKNNDRINQDDESMEVAQSSEEEYDSNLQQNTRRRTRNNARRGNNNQPRRLRARSNRINYEGQDDSSDDYGLEDVEEEKVDPHKHIKQEIIPRSRNRNIINESDEEVDNDVIIPDENIKKLKGDEDYELQMNNVQLQEGMIEDHKCEFCLRVDPPLIGPFVNVKNKSQDKPLMFHKDCIEVNNYSFFNKQKNKWMGIGKALEVFTKKPSMCKRCDFIGATIKCMDCDKFYHGFFCSQLYMLYVGPQQYQCFQCRNVDNYKNLTLKNVALEKSELKLMKRQIQRDHLLQQKQNPYSYQPQVNDVIYYFFQGHEKFISYYNCFFYSGESEALPFQYPWKDIPELEQPTQCRIKKVTYKFPSNNVLYLLKKYGKSQQIPQTPQIITHIELEIVALPDQSFSLDFFPNELPDFLVLQHIYEDSLLHFEQLQEEDKLIGQTFKARVKNLNKVRIVDIQQREPTFYPTTNWEAILYKQEEVYRLRERGRRGLRSNQEEEPPELINFWELNLSQEGQEPEEVQALTNNDKEKLINFLNETIEKKHEQAQPFLERVYDSIAPDYRQHIASEMFFSLIQARVFNDYYRSSEQLFNDIDLIVINAETYNGRGHELSRSAQSLCKNIKSEIAKLIEHHDSKNTQVRHEETKISLNFSNKPIGKLTAPLRQQDMNQTSMDLFRKQQQDINQNGLNANMGRKRETIEEDKNTEMIQPRKGRLSKEKYNEDFNVMIDASDHSDFKITPKTGGFDSEMGSRRQTRGTKINGNESYLENQTFSTGEKIAPTKDHETAEQSVEPLLGKRTRSGRQTKMIKQSLNEDQFDEEFEKYMGDELGNINGHKKRLRQR